MIWVQHDFYKNFTTSVNSNDIGLSLDIFRSEVSDLLTYKSSVLYSLFDKLKIKYKKKSSYEELLDIVLREIKSNDKFIRGLSFLIAESNNVIKNNKGVAWVKLLNGITKGIKKIAKYFKDYPKQEMFFRRRTLEMIGLKSSVTGDDNRDLKKKDNTVLWILGIIAVGVAGYFVYRYFDKQNQDRMRAESLKGMGDKLATGGVVPAVPNQMSGMGSTGNPSNNLDPSFNVPSDVLIPEPPIAPPAPIQPANTGGVNIQVQPIATPNQVVNQVPNQVTNSIQP
jgi:hypothetical protein